MRKLAVVGIVVAVFCMVVLIYAGYFYRPSLLTPLQIEQKSIIFNDMAAVFVPHKLLDFGHLRRQHPVLFEKAEYGYAMSDAESQEYRLLYQSLLQNHQFEFRFFDGDIQIMHDVGMASPNNIAGNGIAGSHDHHDMSVRNNFGLMRENLNILNTHSGLSHINRIWLALNVYKDLTDILLHLGTVPQTKSIGYLAANNMQADEYEQLFELLLQEYKLAQFAAVNSAAYQSHIGKALAIYNQLVFSVQQNIVVQLTPFELYFVGEWGGWQSFSPITFGYRPHRTLLQAN